MKAKIITKIVLGLTGVALLTACHTMMSGSNEGNRPVTGPREEVNATPNMGAPSYAPKEKMMHHKKHHHHHKHKVAKKEKMSTENTNNENNTAQPST